MRVFGLRRRQLRRPSAAARRAPVAGEQRGGVAVRAEAQQFDVEQRPRRIERLGAVIGFERALIGARGGGGVAAGRDAVDVLRRDRRVRQQRLARHAVIAVGMVPRDKALVAPEPMDAVPRHRLAKRRVGEKLIQPPRGRAAGQADRKAARLLRGEIGDPARGPMRQILEIGRDLDAGFGRHRHSFTIGSRPGASGGSRRSPRHNRGAWNTAEPATIALAPASITCQAFSPLSPPSTSITGSKPALVAQPPQRRDLWQHLRQEFLAAKAGVDGHDQHDAAQMQHIFDLRRAASPGSARPRRLCRGRGYATSVRCRWIVALGLAMNEQMIGAGLGEIVEVMLGLDDHQMDIDRLGRRLAAPPRRRPGRS